MKNIFIIIIAFTLFSCNTKKEKQLADKTHILEIGRGKFAFCGASGAVPTGRKIIIQGKTFDEGCAICPVIDGLSIANMELLNYSWDTPDGTDSTVWSLFWYFDSVPQSPTWAVLPTVNRNFITDTTVGGGMSNMFCMPCKILEEKNGVTLAKCYGALNEAAVPLRISMPVKAGAKSITQAPIGSPNPVGTPIPMSNDTKK